MVRSAELEPIGTPLPEERQNPEFSKVVPSYLYLGPPQIYHFYLSPENELSTNNVHAHTVTPSNWFPGCGEVIVSLTDDLQSVAKKKKGSDLRLVERMIIFFNQLSRNFAFSFMSNISLDYCHFTGTMRILCNYTDASGYPC
jgi:hypothetical protein